MVGLVLGAAWSDILFYVLVNHPSCTVFANWLRFIYHVALLLIFVYYIAYICEVTRYENRDSYLLIANSIFALVTIADFVSTAHGPTFIVDADGIQFIGRGIFFFGYIAFSILAIILMTKVRKLIFHRLMFGFYGTIIIAFALLFMQGISGQSSFTVASIMLPVIAIMYFMHSNPYDAFLGSNDINAMKDYIRYCSSKHLDFVFLSLYMKEFDEIGKEFPENMQSTVRNFTYDYIKRSRECSIHRVGPEDITAFNRSEYILKELADINRKCDLNDPRVLVYCQPVLNVKTGEYDTGEALMRLNLPELGIVYPNQFIHLAEEHSFIHTLTEIILHKTCDAIRQFTDAGFQIRRISVNVSALELKIDHFCQDITNIISQSDIPGDKIAIELTESQNEDDFNRMKQKIGELKEKGIKFYLDDFGTGYSNMERIMELPFDIIKFDRSLVIASDEAERSRKMVANLASMFSNMEYDVLYEGIETDTNEQMCKAMSASYLQGFKYSRPEPIVRMTDYLSRPAA